MLRTKFASTPVQAGRSKAGNKYLLFESVWLQKKEIKRKVK